LYCCHESTGHNFHGSAHGSNTEQIEIRDLPDVIRTSLQGEDYAGWTITAAYRGYMNDPADVQATDKEIYIVDLKSGDQMTTATFDKDGNRLDKIEPEDPE
jgi:hypothetical protein